MPAEEAKRIYEEVVALEEQYGYEFSGMERRGRDRVGVKVEKEMKVGESSLEEWRIGGRERVGGRLGEEKVGRY